MSDKNQYDSTDFVFLDMDNIENELTDILNKSKRGRFFLLERYIIESDRRRSEHEIYTLKLKEYDIDLEYAKEAGEPEIQVYNIECVYSNKPIKVVYEYEHGLTRKGLDLFMRAAQRAQEVIMFNDWKDLVPPVSNLIDYL